MDNEEMRARIKALEEELEETKKDYDEYLRRTVNAERELRKLKKGILVMIEGFSHED